MGNNSTDENKYKIEYCVQSHSLHKTNEVCRTDCNEYF